ncbi:MAG: hypothetical protein IT429_25690 [Gemmataceae bacterium]|nr:hypothetical protein [Gemmataceae bacterium]
MSADFDPGRETAVVAAGKTWTVGRIDVGVLERFRDWVQQQEGDPFDGLERLIDRVPKEIALEMIKEARGRRDALRLMDYADPLLQRYQQTVRGSLQLLLLALQTHHPEATLTDVQAVAAQLGWVRVRETLQTSSGSVGGPIPNDSGALPP